MKILHLDLIGGTSVDSTQVILQRSLVTEPVKTDNTI